MQTLNKPAARGSGLAQSGRYLRKHAIAHPVAMDNDYANWNRFENREPEGLGTGRGRP